MPRCLVVATGLVLAVLANPSRALACGGLVTSSEAEGTLGMQAQIALISVGQDSTEFVFQVAVPETHANYGIVLPTPVLPVLDPEPVNTLELSVLEEQTRPTISVLARESGNDGGCGCSGDALAKGGAQNGPGDGVRVIDVVDIGPVTATVVSGTTGTALNDWLGARGFAIPTGSQSLIDGYVASGAFFVAIQRNDSTVDGQSSSVGIRMTLDGQHAGYPLRVSKMGAMPDLSLTIFVASDRGVGPAAPFQALTLLDLDQGILSVDYVDAMRDAIARVGHQAFVVEAVRDVASLSVGSEISDVIGTNTVLTRISAVLSRDHIDADVQFTAAAPQNVTDQVFIGSTIEGVFFGPLGPWLMLAFLVWIAQRGWHRLRRKTAQA